VRDDARLGAAIRASYLILGVALAAAGLLGLAARLSDRPAPFIIIAAAAAPYLGTASLFGLLILGALKAYRLTVVALAITIAALFPQLRIISSGPIIAPPGAMDIRVMTSNLRLGDAQADKLVRLIRSHRVDVISVQELTPTAVIRLKAAGINSVLRYEYLAPRAEGDGVGIFSNRPLTNVKTYAGFTHEQVSAQLDLAGGGEITVFATHLDWPGPGQSKTWATELARLSTVLAAQRGCVIVGGDFNATTSHAQFRQLLRRADVADSAQQSGDIGLRTYPSNTRILPPLVGIDHVLSRGLVAARTTTLDVPGSDHRALLSDLASTGCETQTN
jgi:endonuclease/exonuclease/phosphatase (EEP) superfamily protein YafD